MNIHPLFKALFLVTLPVLVCTGLSRAETFVPFGKFAKTADLALDECQATLLRDEKGVSFAAFSDSAQKRMTAEFREQALRRNYRSSEGYSNLQYRIQQTYVQSSRALCEYCPDVEIFQTLELERDAASLYSVRFSERRDGKVSAEYRCDGFQLVTQQK
jgi:hypothetical protein